MLSSELTQCWAEPTRSHIAYLRAVQHSDMPNNFYPFLFHALGPDDDPDEANRRFLNLQKKLVGFFELSGTYDPATDADETFNRAEDKLAKGQHIPEIKRYCMGIAKNIVRERRRSKQREESAYQKLIDQSQDKSTESLVEKIMNLMKPCFEQLPERDRNLLMSYCKVPPGVDTAQHRRQLAAGLNLSISALRIRVTRLRRSLEDCLRELRKKL